MSSEIEITRSYSFDAAHYLPRVPVTHKCRRMHGHTYTVTLTLRGPIDDDAGWLVDFGDISAHAKPLIDLLDHQTLNDIDGLTNPTSEALAVWIADRLCALPYLVAVTVSETPQTSATYRIV